MKKTIKRVRDTINGQFLPFGMELVRPETTIVQKMKVNRKRKPKK